jgi:hypothetical protein
MACSIKKKGAKEMKKRTMIFVVVVLVLAMLATASVTLAKNLTFNKITGHDYFFVEAWGGVEIWNTIVVKENLLTHVPKGKITVKITSPSEQGVRYYETTPVCVNIYEDENGLWAILVHQITADGVSGFGAGEPGEYAKWKIHDSQAPGGQGDTISLAYGPYGEFWPEGENPGCGDTDFPNTLEVVNGNLVIH